MNDDIESDMIYIVDSKRLRAGKPIAIGATGDVADQINKELAALTQNQIDRLEAACDRIRVEYANGAWLRELNGAWLLELGEDT